MRKELEIIEKIEAYLEGRLSPDETRQFEIQIANDTGLQTQVELQRQLMMGIDRASLKEQVRTAKKNYFLRRNIPRWGLGGLLTAALITALLYYTHNVRHSHTDADTQSEISRDSTLPNQTYRIDPTRDTVIETEKGIVLSIPARTFLDEQGRLATGPIQLVVKEALDPASIMSAGLSTRSGSQILSTGGMFFLDAKQGDQTLHIDTAKPIVAQVPAAIDKQDMQLYKGRRTTNGTIDWVDPRPLEHNLVSVDIQTLDFYPPHYLDSLASWGYDSRDKHFTDSLYYSFADLDRYGGERPRVDTIPDTAYYHPHPCGLNPAKIKTIWSRQFQNTILATREFEQRIHWLHIAGRDEWLDLYVDHLNWDLSAIDSLVATKMGGEASSEFKGIFQFFAAHHDGKVNNTSPQFKELSAYYRTKTKAYMEAIEKTQKEYWDRQDALDQKIVRHDEDAQRRSQQNFEKEFEINMKEACRQLGIVEKVNPPSDAVYTASITGTGWYNVDQAVFASTATRTTLDYTDSSTGKKATIRYTPATFHISDLNSYDKVNVYLLPDQLSSFLLVPDSNGVYKESLNELIKYDLVCIGYKNGKMEYYHQTGIEAKDYTNIQLHPISEDELTIELNKVGSMTQAADLVKENSFFKFEVQDQKRRRHNEELWDLHYKVLKLIFPCAYIRMV